MALSLMLTMSTPASWSSRAGLDRALDAHRSRRIDLDADDEAACRRGATARRVGGGGSVAEPPPARSAIGVRGRAAMCSVFATVGLCARRPRGGDRVERLAHVADVLGRRAAAATDDARAGVEEARHCVAEVGRFGGVHELADRHAGADRRWARSMRASPADGRPICDSASRQISGPTPQLTPTASTPAAARAVAAVCGLVPSIASRSSPKVIWATIGRSDRLCASSTPSSSSSRSLKVSNSRMSTPPSSRPSICSRKASRMTCDRWLLGSVDGRFERPDRPGHQHVRLSGHVPCFARQLRRAAVESAPARSASPNGARRNRLAPNEFVSIASAPASMYSRWMAPIRSGCDSRPARRATIAAALPG